TVLLDRADSLGPRTDAPAGGAVGRVKRAANAQLEAYLAGESGVDQAVLLECLDEMNGLIAALAALPARTDTIRTAYKDEVFNPFTFTVMEEDVKPRLVQTYEQTLLPYLLGRVREEMSCDEARGVRTTLAAVHRRMLALRDENTTKIERKLRRSRDAREVLQLLGVMPS
ncbi:MAG: hypothetical protein WBA12_03445, partial [Catalinimonas sp.]